MTITAIRTTPGDALVVSDHPSLTTAADILLRAMTEAGLDSPRWLPAGPLVSAAAQRLREAMGAPVRGSCGSVAPVVREADFTSAARPLVAEAVVVDPEAAGQFARLAVAAAQALR